MLIKNELLAGISIALASFIWLCLEFVFGMQDTYIDYYMYVSNFAYILPIIGLYWAIKKRYATFTTGAFQLKDGLMSGVIVSVTAAFINLPLQWFFVEKVNPHFFGNMIALEGKKALTGAGNTIVAITDAQAYYNISSFLIQGFTSFLILGLFISLMLSFRLVKRNYK